MLLQEAKSSPTKVCRLGVGNGGVCHQSRNCVSMGAMANFVQTLASCLLVTALFGCGPNVFKPFSNQTSDRALIYEARTLINQRSYAAAVETLGRVSTSGQQSTEFKLRSIEAKSGQCGFEFIRFFERLSTADFTTANLFFVSMQAFRQVAVVPQACQEAEDLIREVQAVNQLPAGFQLFSVFLAFAKIGVILRNKADRDAAGQLGDGAVDPGFDACQTTSLTDLEVAQIIVGFSRLITESSTLASLISGGGFGDSLNDLSALCSSPDLDSFGDFCSATDVTGALAFVDVMRILLQWNQFGVGNCSAADPAQAVLNCCP